MMICTHNPHTPLGSINIDDNSSQNLIRLLKFFVKVGQFSLLIFKTFPRAAGAADRLFCETGEQYLKKWECPLEKRTDGHLITIPELENIA